MDLHKVHHGKEAQGCGILTSVCFGVSSSFSDSSFFKEASCLSPTSCRVKLSNKHSTRSKPLGTNASTLPWSRFGSFSVKSSAQITRVGRLLPDLWRTGFHGASDPVLRTPVRTAKPENGCLNNSLRTLLGV